MAFSFSGNGSEVWPLFSAGWAYGFLWRCEELSCTREERLLHARICTMEVLVVFEHPAVRKSWLTHRIHRDDENEEEAAFRVETILNISTVESGSPGEELVDALTDYLMEHEDIDAVEILPPSIN
jgi:hypothetical protein